MGKTNIEWTENNWNPFYGCRRKSPGCEHCYAEQIASRFSGTDKNGKVLPYDGIAQKVGGKARWTGKVKLNEDILLAPLTIRKPTTFFVNSMSDTFYSEFPDEWIDKLFAVMALCPQHTFQILTKRAERMRDYFNSTTWQERGEIVKPLPNVWLGVSCENQKTADERIPYLLETPATIRFLSCEPLLEDINLHWRINVQGGYAQDYLGGQFFDRGETDENGQAMFDGRTWKGEKVDWVIVGGESGSGARPCDIEWIRSIVNQCQSAGAKVFVKQLGSLPRMFYPNVGKTLRYPLSKKNKKGGDITEFPKDLQIREMPVKA